MADAKTVRLTNDKGVTVVTTEDIAARLSGFEPVKAPKAKSGDDKSEK